MSPKKQRKKQPKKSKTKKPKSKAAAPKKKVSLRNSSIKDKTRKKKSPKRGARAKKASVNTARELAQEIRNRRLAPAKTGSSRQSDFAGLSRKQEADSESVDELVEEGNIFEAGAVAGVEEADNSDEREVHTHEVPEDDVPDEYREED
jgi:hypothetical protein